MVRGLERRVIFREDADRDDFLARLATLADAGTLTVYAWALTPNHAHFLVRTGNGPLVHTGQDFHRHLTRGSELPWSEVPVARRSRRW
jgi:REP element-mobilizing transposase RayT